MLERPRWIVLLAGVGCAAIAGMFASTYDMPEWFARAVYRGAGYIAGSLLVTALLTHLLGRHFPGRLMSVSLLSIAVAAAAAPNAYLIAAVFLGRTKADVETWHLLPLFAAVYQLEAVAVVIVAAGCVFLSAHMLKKLRRRGETR